MLTLNDGRSELWQWDTGRTLDVDADCSQVHFSNKVFGRSIDVDVIDGVAIIPDILLQTDKDLNVWAFVGAAENGYTKISKIFKVNRRNKPADYVFTPQEQVLLKDAIAIVETAKSAANDAIESAKQAEAAQQGAEVAKDAAELAKTAAETAANNASKSAADALSAKNEAETSKNAAAGSAEAAQNSKNAAAQSAEAANTAKTAAQEAAGAAQQAAADANASAQQAAESAETLSGAIADVAQLKSDILQKADKTALAKTDRSLNALWKLNQGITYEFQTDGTEAYSKTVPSGAKLASVEKIGGKTVVWNQLMFNSNFDDPKGFKTMGNSTLSIVENKAHIHRDENTGGTASIIVENNYRSTAISGRMYLLGVTVRTANCMVSLMPTGTAAGGVYPYASYPNATRIRYIWNCKETGAYEMEIRGWTGSGVTSEIDFTVEKYFFFDLTSMFGAGNEPTSTDAPHIEWIEQYAAVHPEYNAGALVSADVESVKYNDTVVASIPESVLTLPGYGWSASDACNSIERTDTGWQYVQRVGSRDYKDGDTVTDGKITYYELGAPIITDITDLMGNALDAITVEAGGTLTFENAAQLPVPNSAEYAVKLSEVIQS